MSSIVGYSGSGKTTLISLIAGLIAAGSRRDPASTAYRSTSPGPERGIVFQNYSLLPWLTVFENIYLAVDAVSPDFSARGQTAAHASSYVELVNLGARYGQAPARALRRHAATGGGGAGLAMDRKVLLLDEPFSALDALTRATLQDELARIWMRERKTVVMITNDVEEAILLADTYLSLDARARRDAGTGDRASTSRARAPERSLSLDPTYQQRAARDHRQFSTAGQGRAGRASVRPHGRDRPYAVSDSQG